MADRSLRARLSLAADLLLVTGLALGYDLPDFRAPGRPEESPGVPTELFCPREDPSRNDSPCIAKLTRRQDLGGILFCRDHGPIGDDEALIDPPPRS